MRNSVLNVVVKCKINNMNTFKGVILVREVKAGSKSDGSKAYFIDENLNNYQLYRKGVLDTNDHFFNPFNLKEVELSGEIQRQKWIQVESVEAADAIVAPLVQNEGVNFVTSDFPDLINSEGPLLSIVEQKYFTQDSVLNSRLWLKGRLTSGKAIYTKVNETALLFFFQGRITVRELFLLRNDEVYLIEDLLERKTSLNQEYYSEKLDELYLKQLSCASLNYYSIERGMRLEHPFEDVIKKLEQYWLNSHEFLNQI